MRLRQRGPQLRVGRHAADDRHAIGAGGLDPLDERTHDRALVARGQVGAAILQLAGVIAQLVEEGGLHTREREVEPVYACDREPERLRVARGWSARLGLNPEMALGEAYMEGGLILEQGSFWDL